MGGTGNDNLTGELGLDQLQGNDGQDVITWSRFVGPETNQVADSVDQIDGGDQDDTLLVIGGPDVDMIELGQPVPGTTVHVEWTNITDLTVDPTSIEYLTLDLEDGADKVTVDDLSDTELTQLQLDLGRDAEDRETTVDQFASTFEVDAIVGTFDNFAGLQQADDNRANVQIDTVQVADTNNNQKQHVYHDGASGAFTLTFAARDEHQTVFLQDGASGNFTLRFRDETTDSIAASATADDIKAALEALPSIGLVYVTGSGNSLDPWDVRFIQPSSGAQAIGQKNIEQLTSVSAFVVIDSIISGSDQPVTTIPIDHQAPAEEVQHALESLTGNRFNVSGTGIQADPWVIEYLNSAGTTVPEITSSTTGLLDLDQFAGLEQEDGTEATVTITTVQAATANHDEIRSLYHNAARGSFSLVLDQQNEVQRVTHNAQQGDFSLTYNGHQTVALQYDALADEVESALTMLPGIGADDVAVTKTVQTEQDNVEVSTWKIEFVGELSGQNVAQVGADFGNLSRTDGTAVVGSVDTIVSGGEVTTDLIEHDASPAQIAAVLSKAAGTTFRVSGRGTQSQPWLVELEGSAGITVPQWTAVTQNTSGYGAYAPVDAAGNPADVRVENAQTPPPGADVAYDVWHDGAAGGFTLSYAEQTTRILDYDISATDLASALNSLTTGNTTVSVTGSGTEMAPWIVGFQNPVGTLSASSQGVDLPTGRPATFVTTTVTPGNDGVQNETQRITYVGSGESFQLSFRGASTGSLASNISAAMLQTALEDLDTIGANNVSVSDDGQGAWIVEFEGVLGGQDVDAITAVPDDNSLVEIATTATGVGNEVQQISYVGAGETFQLSFRGIETAELARDVAPAQLQAALEALGGIGTGNVFVTQNGDGVWNVAFVNLLGGQDVPEIAPVTDQAGNAAVEVATIAIGTDGNEIQQLYVDSTDGSFRLTFQGQTTESLGVDSTPDQVQSALENLTTIGAGNVDVSGVGTEVSPWTITFVGNLGHQDVSELVLSSQDSQFDGAVQTAVDGSGQGEVQQLYHNADAGVFELTFLGWQSDPLPFDATADEIRIALETLNSPDPDDAKLKPPVQPGDVTVTGSGKLVDPWEITFQKPVDRRIGASIVQLSDDELAGDGSQDMVHLFGTADGDTYTVVADEQEVNIAAPGLEIRITNAHRADGENDKLTIETLQGADTVDAGGSSRTVDPIAMVFITNGGADRLIGSHFDDVLDSGQGNDTVSGNAGIDQFIDAGGTDVLVETQDADMSLFGDQFIAGKIVSNTAGDHLDKGNAALDARKTPPDPNFPAPVITTLADDVRGDVYAATYVDYVAGITRDVQIESLLNENGRLIFERAQISGREGNNTLVVNDDDNFVSIVGRTQPIAVKNWTNPVTLDNRGSSLASDPDVSFNEYYILNLTGDRGLTYSIADTGNSGFDEVYLFGTDADAAKGITGEDIFSLNAFVDPTTEIKAGQVIAGAAMLDENTVNPDREVIVFTGVDRLQLHTLGGDDAVLSDDTAVQTLIDLGAGDDEITVGTVPLVPDPDNPTIEFPDGVPVADTDNMTNGVSNQTIIFGQQGNDVFEVDHNAAELFMHGGADDDRFVVNTFLKVTDENDNVANTATLFGGDGNNQYEHVVDAPISINGGSGTDTTVVVGTPLGETLVITEHFIAGAGGITYYTNVDVIELDAAGGDDQIYILGADPDIETIVRGDSGDDTIHVGGNHETLLISPPSFTYTPPPIVVQLPPSITYSVDGYMTYEKQAKTIRLSNDYLMTTYGIDLDAGDAVNANIVFTEVFNDITNTWTPFLSHPGHQILTGEPVPANMINPVEDTETMRFAGGLDDLRGRSNDLGYKWKTGTQYNSSELELVINYTQAAVQVRQGDVQNNTSTIQPPSFTFDPPPLALHVDPVYDVSQILGRVSIDGGETFESTGDTLIVHNQQSGETTAALTTRKNVGASAKSPQLLSPDPTTKSASFEVWFQPSDLSGKEVLFETGGNNVGSSLVLDDNMLHFTISDNGFTKQVSQAITSVGDFIHAVGVVQFGSTKQMHLYVDQLPVQSTGLGSISAWSGNNDMGISDTASQLGGNHAGQLDGFGPLEGTVANVRLYNKALSANEIQVLRDAMAVPDTLLDFDARAGQSQFDGSGNLLWQTLTGVSGFDWTLNADVQRVTDSKTATQFEQAYEFGGLAGGTAASLANAAGVPTSNSASFEIWFKPDNLSGKKVLFETGSAAAGTSFTLDGQTLEFTTTSANDDGNSAATVHQTAPISTAAAGDFIQAVGVIDFDTGGDSQIVLYVNGQQIQSTSGPGLTSWADADPAGLGGIAGMLGGNVDGMLDNYLPYAGQVAAVKVYSTALDQSQVQALFNAAQIAPLLDYDARLDTGADLFWENATSVTGRNLNIAAGAARQSVASASFPQITSARSFGDRGFVGISGLTGIGIGVNGVKVLGVEFENLEFAELRLGDQADDFTIGNAPDSQSINEPLPSDLFTTLVMGAGNDKVLVNEVGSGVEIFGGAGGDQVTVADPNLTDLVNYRAGDNKIESTQILTTDDVSNTDVITNSPFVFANTQGEDNVTRWGNEPVGTLESEPFTLGANALISFEAAGAGGRLELVDTNSGGVLTSTPINVRSDTMTAHIVPAPPLAGRLVKLRIVDDQSGPWGFVAVDNLVYATPTLQTTWNFENASLSDTTGTNTFTVASGTAFTSQPIPYDPPQDDPVATVRPSDGGAYHLRSDYFVGPQVWPDNLFPITADDLSKVNEQQEIFHDATSGVFTLTFDGQTTGAMLHNVNSGDLQSQLESLSSIGAGNVHVTGKGTSSVPWMIEFQGALEKQDVPQLTGNFSNLKTAAGDPASVTILTTLDPLDQFTIAHGSERRMVFVVDSSDSRNTTGDSEVWARTVVLDPDTGRIVEDTVQKRRVQTTDDDGNPLWVGSFEGGVVTTTSGDVPALTVIGSAMQLADRMRLTSSQPGQAGAVWTSSPLPFGADYSFTAEMTIDVHSAGGSGFDDGDGKGADGLTFVLQSGDAQQIGLSGGTLALPDDDVPFVAIEFDAWHSETYDPNFSSVNLDDSQDDFPRTLDIGNPGVSGATGESIGVYTITTSGAGITGMSDEFRYLHTRVTGDTEMIVRVTADSFDDNTSANAQAGIMFRASEATGAQFVELMQRKDKKVVFRWRDSDGASIMSDGNRYGDGSSAKWLRLLRFGDEFTASFSTDGASWTEIGSHTTDLNDQSLVGLAVTSNNHDQTTTAKFDNVHLSSNDHLPSHIGIDTNAQGSVARVGVPNYYAGDEGENLRFVRVDYDGSAGRMDVYFTASPLPTDGALPAPTLSADVDLSALFSNSQSLFAGWTGATGRQYLTQDVLQWTLDVDDDRYTIANQRDVPTLFTLTPGESAKYLLGGTGTNPDDGFVASHDGAWNGDEEPGARSELTIHALGDNKFAIQNLRGRYLSAPALSVTEAVPANSADSIGPQETFEILSLADESSTNRVIIRQGTGTFDKDGNENFIGFFASASGTALFEPVSVRGAYDVLELTEIVPATHRTTADTYVQKGNGNTNYGKNTEILVKYSTASSGDRTRGGIISFPVSQIPENIIGASIALDVASFNSGDNEGFYVYGIQDGSTFENQSETEPTWNKWSPPFDRSSAGVDVTDSSLYDPDPTQNGAQPLGILTFASGALNKTVYFTDDNLVKFLQVDTNGHATILLTRVRNSDSFNSSFASKEHQTLNPPRLFTFTEAVHNQPLPVFADSADPVGDPGSLLWLREDGLEVDYLRSVTYNASGIFVDVFFPPVPSAVVVNRTEATPIEQTVVTTTLSTPSPNDTIVVLSTGTVSNADVFGANVWFDVNRDGIMNLDESLVVSDIEGNFELAILESLDVAGGIIRAAGGIDVGTGVSLITLLTATTQVEQFATPLTTLAHQLSEQGFGDPAARLLIQAAFSIDSSVDIGNFDHFEEALLGNPDAKNVLVALSTIQDISTGIMQLLAAITDADLLVPSHQAALTDAVYGATAEQLLQDSLDPTRVDDLAAIVQRSATRLEEVDEQYGLTLVVDHDLIDRIQDGVASILAADSIRLQILADEATGGHELVTRVNQVKKHSQLAVGPALAQVGRGELGIDDAVAQLARTGDQALEEVRQVLLPPHMDRIHDLEVLEEQSVDTTFGVFDFETAFEDVSITAVSSDAELVPNENILTSVGVDPAARFLVISPAEDQSGLVTVDLTVHDEDGFQLTQSFAVTVIDVNDAPTFTPGADEIASRNDQPVDVAWASDISAGTPQEDLNGQLVEFQVAVASGDEMLFELLPTIDAATGRLGYVPDPARTGVATVTVSLMDDGDTENGGRDTSDPFTFTIAIAPAAAQIQTIIVDVLPTERLDPVDEITIVFSQPVTGFDVSDLTLRRDGGENLLDETTTLTSTGGIIWTLGNLQNATGLPGQYALTFAADASDVTSLDGTARSGDAVELWQNVVQPGDTNRDGSYDELDVIAVLQAGKYRTGAPANWEEGDYNGDGLFDELDIIASLQTGLYNEGPYFTPTASAVGPGEAEAAQRSVVDAVFDDDRRVVLSANMDVVNEGTIRIAERRRLADGQEAPRPQRGAMVPRIHRGQEAVESRLAALKAKRWRQRATVDAVFARTAMDSSSLDADFELELALENELERHYP